jgi:oligoribonuclease
MSNPKPSHHRVVVDLETSGRAPEHGVVMEIGAVVVDPLYRPVDDGVSAVVHRKSQSIKTIADEFAWKMHTGNGLIADCEASSLSLADAENVVLDYLSVHGAKGEMPLMNNNAPFERSWMSKHLPGLQEFLHYRNLDVSSLKELARTSFPELYAKAPVKPDNHRALSDCFACAAEIRHYVGALLPVPDIGVHELTGFINDKSLPGVVQEWDTGSGDDIPLIDFGTPDEARADAFKILAAADYVENNMMSWEQMGVSLDA